MGSLRHGARARNTRQSRNRPAARLSPQAPLQTPFPLLYADREEGAAERPARGVVARGVVARGVVARGVVARGVVARTSSSAYARLPRSAPTPERALSGTRRLHAH